MDHYEEQEFEEYARVEEAREAHEAVLRALDELIALEEELRRLGLLGGSEVSFKT